MTPSDVPPEHTAVPTPQPDPWPSYFSLLPGWTGFSCSYCGLPLERMLDIKFLNPHHFAKCSHSKQVLVFQFTPADSVHIASVSTPSPSDLGPDDDEDTPSVEGLLTKYMPWASTVFSAVKVDNLPPHQPYNCTINLEDGKNPPFGPLYRLSPDKCATLATFLDENL